MKGIILLIQTLLAAAATSSLPLSTEASLWNKSKGAAVHGDTRKDRASLPLPHSLTLGGQTTAGGKQHAVKSSSVTPRIIGGAPVESGFEWFADWHGCGGALIHEDIVVTAAHCGAFYDDQVYLNAIVSPNERRALQEGPEQHTITARRVHPYYDPFQITNDVMLLKIDAPSTIPPLRINDDPALPVDGEPLTVIGHGVTDIDDYYHGSETLQQVTIPAASISQCAAEYQDFFIPIDPDVHLCSGGEGDKGACFGDSGGPVMMQDSTTGDYILAGIVSFGINCAEPGLPEVNTRVSSMKAWIDQEICDLSSNPPANCPTVRDDLLPVRINVQLDDFGEEAVWSVSQNDTNIFRAQGYYDLDDFAPLASDLLLLAPGDYEFTIVDLFGDGLFGGGITILLETEVGDDVVLAESDGDYTFRRQFMFTVPAGVSNTAPLGESDPPVDGDCEDTEETFVVSDAVGTRDCAWLSVNLERFGWLCQFVDVAAACPSTCEACHLFDDDENAQ